MLHFLLVPPPVAHAGDSYFNEASQAEQPIPVTKYTSKKAKVARLNPFQSEQYNTKYVTLT